MNGNERNVFVPQIPCKFDKERSVWLPTISMKPAAEFGKLIEVFPSGNFDIKKSREIIQNMLKDAQDGDYLIAVGDPTLIAMTAIYLDKITCGDFYFLKWDKMISKYTISKF